MKKVNTHTLKSVPWVSPKGKYVVENTLVSEALGRKPLSMHLEERHPFDVTIARISAGASNYPYHAHSAQWEFYHVISGSGTVRHPEGTTAIEPGDAFVFGPGQAHQLTNTGTADLIVYVVSDNPLGESCYYPDSQKWLVRSPERRLMRSDALDYYDGEE